MKDLCRLFGVTTEAELPATASYSSSRGKHLLFRWNDALGVPGKAVLHYGKLGVRVAADGKGAQSVFPPSIHPNGARYTWVPGREPDTVGVAELPEAVIARLVQPDGEDLDGDRAPKARDKLYEAEPVREGNRHEVILSEANALWGEQARLRPNGWLDDDEAGQRVWTRLASLNRARCKPPLPGKELRTIFQSAKRFIAKQEAEPWPELERFDAVGLPPFPVDALPEALQEWVKAESLATQTPPDLAGLLCLATCAALIARRVEVEPRAGWREPTNLFVAVLLPPGNRKSAVFADAVAPIREIEAELIERERPIFAQAQSDRHRKEARLRKMEKLAAEKMNPEAAQEADNLARELAEEPEVSLPRLLVDDSTAEKLAMTLSEQDGRIASMSPEGGVFDLMAGLYSKSGMPQFGVYLQAHSGDDLLVDRVSRKSVRVKKPALTCAYTIQPQVISGLADKSAFRGRGLLGRFLYANPPSWIGKRMIGAPPVPDATKESYRQAVQELWDNLQSIQNDSLPIVLRLSYDASQSQLAWETEIERELAEGGQMEAMEDWGAKLAGATLRIAAAMHCVECWPSEEIDTDTLAAAIQVTRYLIPHAKAVFRLMDAKEETANKDAKYLWRWVESNRLETFTRREAHRHGHARFKKAEDLDSPLGELVRRGYIRQRPTPATGGRPASPVYEVNPSALKTSMPESGDVSDKIPAEAAKTTEIETSVSSVTGSEEIENQKTKEDDPGFWGGA